MINWEDLKKVNPLWYIVISLVLISSWAAFGDQLTTDKVVILFFQIVFMAVGSYGTYLKGELSLQDSSQIRKEHFRQQARDRYRRLHGLFGEIVSANKAIRASQKANVTPTERNIIVGGVSRQLETVLRSIARCMESWRDFAPNELEELHRELLVGEGEEE